jgi:hypothetical protein
MVIVLTRSRAGFFPLRSAFPAFAPGRHPHRSFRGLLELYSRYGPPDCSPTMRGLCREASDSPVSRTIRSPAIEPNHQLFEWVLPPLVISPIRAHAKAPAPLGGEGGNKNERPSWRSAGRLKRAPRHFCARREALKELQSSAAQAPNGNRRQDGHPAPHFIEIRRARATLQRLVILGGEAATKLSDRAANAARLRRVRRPEAYATILRERRAFGGLVILPGFDSVLQASVSWIFRGRGAAAMSSRG